MFSFSKLLTSKEQKTEILHQVAQISGFNVSMSVSMSDHGILITALQSAFIQCSDQKTTQLAQLVKLDIGAGTPFNVFSQRRSNAWDMNSSIDPTNSVRFSTCA